MPLELAALLNASLRDCQPVLRGRGSGLQGDAPYRGRPTTSRYGAPVFGGPLGGDPRAGARPPAQRRADRHQGGLRTSDNLLDAGLSARHLVAATETSLGQTDSQFPRHMAG